MGAERGSFYNKFVTKIDLCAINDKRNGTSYIFTILVKGFWRGVARGVAKNYAAPADVINYDFYQRKWVK